MVAIIAQSVVRVVGRDAYAPRRSDRSVFVSVRPLLAESGEEGVVAGRIKRPGIIQEQVDSAHDHINPDRTPPKGLLFHASGPVDGGWGIIDFWESREDFAAAGVEPQRPPDIKEFPVHEMIDP
jgi:hypothetical protein